MKLLLGPVWPFIGSEVSGPAADPGPPSAAKFPKRTGPCPRCKHDESLVAKLAPQGFCNWVNG